VQIATQKVRSNPAVVSVQTDEKIGSATLFVGLKEKGDRVGQSEVEEKLRPLLAQVPSVRLSVSQGGPGGGSKELEITLGSENPEALNQAADALEKQMQQVPGLIEVNSSASLRKPEILITPNPQSAADQGVTVPIAVVGGLITSTMLTLVVVPVIFSYFDGWLSRSVQPKKSRSSRQWKLKFPKLPV
jgi:multidrug efflux pump subunit AcrB